MCYERVLSPKEFYDNHIKMDLLINILKREIGYAIADDCVEEDNFISFIMTIAGGHHGYYQGREIIRYFLYDIDEKFESDEGLFDEIDSFTNDLAELINEEISSRGYHFKVYFGHFDSDSSYGLFASLNKEYMSEGYDKK